MRAGPPIAPTLSNDGARSTTAVSNRRRERDARRHSARTPRPLESPTIWRRPSNRSQTSSQPISVSGRLDAQNTARERSRPRTLNTARDRHFPRMEIDPYSRPSTPNADCLLHRIPGKARSWWRASVCRDLRCLSPVANSRFPHSRWRHLHLRGMPGGRRFVEIRDTLWLEAGVAGESIGRASTPTQP